MSDEANRLEAIFTAALAKPTREARAAYLDEACAQDAILRQRLLGLLEAHDQAGSFLQSPAPEISVTTDQGARIDGRPPHAAEGPGTRVGPYKLLEQIGEGGMGVVYMADQEQPVKRRVALKIIRPGMDSAQVIARFEAERQALAMMDHPNIAKVLDGGATASGRPYFVMELVHGVPITRFCDLNRLNPQQRLELFVPVCQAIQHAHQKAVIHRDVKPSNVLVTLHDDKPVPKVIDFGVAKALQQPLTEKTLFTHFGAMVGTLEYMSPEQAEMNAFGVDTRSDVYSLGVLLYELLTGTTPLERKRLSEAAYAEVLRLIKEEEPPPPSARLSSSGDLPRIAAARKTEATRLPSLLRGEIDWIVMRCLEKDRSRRYESASALARDVERHLRDEAVEACPPSVAYRLRKLIRKNRVLLSTAAAFGALLLLAAVVSATLAIRASRALALARAERAKTDTARQLADLERDRAKQEWHRAEEAVAEAKASVLETRGALGRLAVAQGIKLAEEGDLFRALLWFAKPLERGGLTPEQESVHRIRIACYLRYAQARPALAHMFFQDAPVTHAAFSADSRRVATVSSRMVSIWDIRSGRSVATLRHPVEVTAAQFTPDGVAILTTSKSAVWTWDLRDGRPLGPPLENSAGPEQPSGAEDALVQTPRISRDGRRVLFVTGRSVRVVDRRTARLIGEWSRGSGYDVALAPDGERLLVNSDGVLRVHEVSSAAAPGRVIDHGSAVQAAEFSPDGSRALSIGKDGTARVWNAINWQPIARIVGLDSHSAVLGAFSPDNRLIAFWKNENNRPLQLSWCDVESGRLVREIADNDGDFQSFDWRADGQQLLRVSKWGDVTLFSALNDWKVGMVLPVARAPGSLNANENHRWPIGAAVYAPDGRTFLTATSDGVVRIWDLVHSKGDVQEEVPLGEHWDDAIVPMTTTGLESTVGEGSATWSTPLVGRVEKQSVPDRARTIRLLPPGTTFEDGAVSPDGRRVLTRNGTIIQLWDAGSGQRVGTPFDAKSSINFATFSPDSRRIVVASMDKAARMLDARTGEPLGAPLRHAGSVLRALFSPDGKQIVTCSQDGTARVWETQTGRPQGKDLIHGGAVTRAVFSPGGEVLGTASLDRTLRLWRVEHDLPLGVIELKDNNASEIFFHPNGLLVLAAVAAQVRIWDTASRQEVSPKLKGFASAGWESGLRLDERGRFSVGFRWGVWNRSTYDLTPDERPARDLVALCQLYAGERLDESDGLVPLGRQEIEAMWNALSARYPEDFRAPAAAAVEWRLAPLETFDEKSPAQIALLRRWLAAELEESGWKPGEKGNESLVRGSYLERLCALAENGRHEEATAAALALVGRWPDAAQSCACVFALASRAVKTDAALAERYAARAVALLRQAAAIADDAGKKGLFDAPDLDALRARTDFRELERSQTRP